MTDLDRVFDLGNLRRAYRWVMSNPDPLYKSYFRDSYDAFAIASDTHLKWIRREGVKERYQVSHASKILTPKPSGTLRPTTLLTVEDQIVYQACINLIADELKRKTGKRYEKRVFAHLYAGKSSRFFYLQWQRSYRKFAKRIEAAYHDGYEYVADFDLASFYDSIDHHVLRHFLHESSIDEDTISFLLECLKVWTSSTWSTGPENIYHEHGIPQGPLASGMLSETVLQHIDRAGEQGKKTIYLRYVDDIKILAKKEEELRRKLIKLDITAREIGLFLQAAKINIHRIDDPYKEVKSVSRPAEPSIRPEVDQKKLTQRLLVLSRYGKIDAANATRFKYLLAHANPTHRLNSRLIKTLSAQPEFAPSICGYISKYKKIPRKFANEIDRYLRGPELYHSVTREPDWWVKKCAIRELSVALYGEATYADFVNRGLRASEAEVARIAAARLLQDNVKLTTPYGNVETTAKQILKASRIIRAVGQPESRINQILAYIIGRKETAYDWKKFFGKKQLSCRAYDDIFEA